MREEEWGDVRDWKDWRDRNAALIAQDIVNRNGGNWPHSIEEWTTTAARYDLKLHVVPDVSEPAMTVDNTIVVRLIDDHSQMVRHICHEIAEAASQREIGIKPFLFTSPADEWHEVACRTEQLL